MSTYEISKSSLLSLKAEILRKQQELSKTRAENEVKARNLKKTAPLEIKNKGVEQRQKNDISEEEQNLLKLSRSALEQKARLYDKLSKGNADLTEEQIEFNRRYLVCFDKKAPDLPPESDEDDVDRYPESDGELDLLSDSYDPPKDPGEEWVEYVDCLGRTRTCLKKDLAYLKSKDRDLKPVVDARREQSQEPEREPEQPPEQPTEEALKMTEESELLSGDMRRELLRRQWEQEEEELRDKTSIHYQDILFNEARTHGVGYYGFSKDEEERRRQQEALSRLREETKQQQKKSQDLKALREKQLAARVKAAKNRKRARLGLPPEEDEPEPKPEEGPKEEAPAKDEANDENEKALDALRRKHVRPWDIGKEGVKEHYEYSQEEWVDKKRKERPSEFAPPSAYQHQRGFRSTVEKGPDTAEERTLKFTTRDYRKSLKAVVNPYKNTSSSYRPMEPVPIINECVSETGATSEYQDALLADYNEILGQSKCEETETGRGRGVEIAPPPTFDYYGPNSGKRPKRDTAAVMNKTDILDSIEAGLKYLREKVERKEARGSRREEECDTFYS